MSDCETVCGFCGLVKNGNHLYGCPAYSSEAKSEFELAVAWIKQYWPDRADELLPNAIYLAHYAKFRLEEAIGKIAAMIDANCKIIPEKTLLIDDAIAILREMKRGGTE